MGQPALVQEFIQAGYRGLFDYVYMPMNFRAHGNFGYAFVNFVSHATALQFIADMRRVEHGDADDQRRWDLVWSTCQGLNANIARYRNSPLMHELVPKECKPAMYDETGSQTVFPSPTKTIPKPKIHWTGGNKGLGNGAKDKDLEPEKRADVSVNQCGQLGKQVFDGRPGRGKHQRQQRRKAHE